MGPRLAGPTLLVRQLTSGAAALWHKILALLDLRRRCADGSDAGAPHTTVYGTPTFSWEVAWPDDQREPHCCESR